MGEHQHEELNNTPKSNDDSDKQSSSDSSIPLSIRSGLKDDGKHHLFLDEDMNEEHFYNDEQQVM